MSYHYRTEHIRHPSCQQNDLVKVVKNTRGKHVLPKATKGNEYLVISHYTNSFGTTKYIVLDKEGIEHFTTDNAIEKVLDFTIESSRSWSQAKRIWMDRTYNEILVTFCCFW